MPTPPSNNPCFDTYASLEGSRGNVSAKSGSSPSNNLASAWSSKKCTPSSGERRTRDGPVVSYRFFHGVRPLLYGFGYNLVRQRRFGRKLTRNLPLGVIRILRRHSIPSSITNPLGHYFLGIRGFLLNPHFLHLGYHALHNLNRRRRRDLLPHTSPRPPEESHQGHRQPRSRHTKDPGRPTAPATRSAA